MVTIDKSKKQYTLDFVVEFALSQRRKSMITVTPILGGGNEPGYRCLYYGPNSTRCFVGALLDDERVQARGRGTVEGKSVMVLLEMCLIRKEFSQESLFLTEFQKIHDGTPMSQWGSAFARLAKKYGLTFDWEAWDIRWKQGEGREEQVMKEVMTILSEKAVDYYVFQGFDKKPLPSPEYLVEVLNR